MSITNDKLKSIASSRGVALLLCLAFWGMSLVSGLEASAQVRDFAADECDFKVTLVGPVETGDSVLPDGGNVRGWYQSGDDYLRMVRCYPKPAASQKDDLSKERLGDFLMGVAGSLNIRNATLAEDGEVLVLKGIELSRGKLSEWRLVAREGRNSRIILLARGPMADFPQRKTSEFLQSLREK